MGRGVNQITEQQGPVSSCYCVSSAEGQVHCHPSGVQTQEPLRHPELDLRASNNPQLCIQVQGADSFNEVFCFVP